jgi:hypothetical protein
MRGVWIGADQERLDLQTTKRTDEDESRELNSSIGVRVAIVNLL